MRPYMLWLTCNYCGASMEYHRRPGLFDAVVNDWARRLRENEWRGARA